MNREVLCRRGCILMPEITIDHREKAYALLKADAEQILRLIEVQMKNLTMPQCPLYERSEEHTSELQSRGHLVCRLLLEKKKKHKIKLSVKDHIHSIKR